MRDVGAGWYVAAAAVLVCTGAARSQPPSEHVDPADKAVPGRTVRVERTPGSLTRSFQVTGPAGATYRRELQIERGPGQLSRQIEIERPGGAKYAGSVQATRAVPRAGGPAPRGPVVVQRNVTVNRFGPGPGWGWGPPQVGGSSLAFFFGAPPPPPIVSVPVVVPVAPPVVYAPAPVPPHVVVMEPERFRQEPETIVVDPVGESLKRLASHHDNSREAGARELGRLGDARAVPALMDLLRNDADADVRTAAAEALGAIGDPQAAGYLKRAAVYDRKPKVREAAKRALQRLERVAIVEPRRFETDVPAPPAPRLQSADQPALLPDPLPLLEDQS